MKIGVLFRETIRMSIQAVRLNKLRSLLSILGITIGIFCVVAVYSLVHSLENSLNSQFNKLGKDIVFVQKWPWDDFGNSYPWWEFLKRPKSSPSDAEFLRSRMPDGVVESTAYIYKYRFETSAQGRSLKGLTTNFITHEFGEIQPIDIEKGRYFTAEESRAGRPVAIIGNKVALGLFGKTDVVGESLRIANNNAIIVGVCEFQGDNMIGASNDNLVYLPVNWGRTFANYRNGDDAQILLKAAQGTDLKTVRFEARRLMRQARRLKPTDDDDFAVNQMSMITEVISDLFEQIRKIGLIIGGFAMLVGCFGVANIMFVSVKERTREIGVQKALGATNTNISLQFLLESIWLSIAGGFIGILLVQGVLYLLGLAAQSQMPGLILSMGPEDTLFGVLTSVLVGMVAGFLPARSAAKLTPVEAIRS